MTAISFWNSLLQYGNYGGPNWTGGEVNGSNFNIDPVNGLDFAFRKHDAAYQSNGVIDRNVADLQLQADIISLWRTGELNNYHPRDKLFAFGCAMFYFPLQVTFRPLARPFVNFAEFVSPLISLLRDPLIIDLDGDGITLTALGVAGEDGASGVFFDYDGDGFGERTGWVSPNDGILVHDRNRNGTVDGASEIFGSPDQDGYAVLETLDSNGDGVIDAADSAFADLRVWRDLNSNGLADAGELQTLAEAGLASLNLTRTDVSGLNTGHTRGFSGVVTRTDGTTTTAETIYFQTDRRTTQDNTPPFTPAEGIDRLPQLPGSGQISAIGLKLTQDVAFRAAWRQGAHIRLAV
jgi:hypothetical protein